MPSMLMLADTQFPRFTETEGNDEKFDKVYNYLYMLLEQLRYTLSNLGSENFNTSDLGEIGEVITAPLSDELQVFRRQMVGEDGAVSLVTQTCDALTSRIASAEGSISTLEQTSDSLTFRIGKAEGAITEIKQTGSGLSLSVSNSGTSSTIKLWSNSVEISSATVNITGVLTVSHLKDGETVISGANIQTGTISSIGISACTIVGGTITSTTLNSTTIKSATINSATINSATINGSTINLYYNSSTGTSTPINFTWGDHAIGSLKMYTDGQSSNVSVGIRLEANTALKLYSLGNMSIEAKGTVFLYNLQIVDSSEGAWTFKSDGIYHGNTKVVSG